MYYVYLLQSQKDKSLYIGYSSDLKKRLLAHNSGKNFSTKRLCPWILVYYEAYLHSKVAREREKQLKRFAKSYAMLKKRIGLL